MADIIFTDATVLSYDVENYFLGDGVARYGSTKRLSIEVMSYNINVGGRTIKDDGNPGDLNTSFNNDGISETWDNLTTYLNNANNFENIKIKVGGTNWELGKGIIESISTTEQNPIRVGYHRFNIEIPEASIDGLPNSGSYEGIKDAFEVGGAELIRDFSESFNFSEDEDGSYTHEHTVSIRFEEGKGSDDATSGEAYEIIQGKAFADQIFDASNTPAFGFVVRPGLFNNTEVKGKRHYYTETYDAFTKSCSFVKRITIRDENEDDYTKKLRHAVSLGADGIILVTENCEIKGKETYDQALAGMEQEIGDASGRCVTVFNNNLKFLGGSGKYNGKNSAVENAEQSPDALNTGNSGLSRLNQAMSISRQHNRRNKSVNYTITFNNDPAVENNFIHERSLNYTEGQNGMLTISENGRIRPYGQKTKNAFSSIKSHLPSAATLLARAQEYYSALRDSSGPTQTDLKPVAMNTTFTGGRAGMEISYSKVHSDDTSLRFSYNISSAGSSSPSAVATPSSLKKVNVSISDTIPQLIRSTYVIPNKKDGYQLIHEPDDSLGKQTNMGSRTVEIRSQKARVQGQNVYSTFPSLSTELNYLKQLALIKGAEVISDFKLGKTDLFVSDCSYSFDNSRQLNFRLNVHYVTKSNVEYSNINPKAINTQNGA
tara:strand:- start:27505 stop:29481 length:1977 start_codon:yes stop_codon:yes gene_type:complete